MVTARVQLTRSVFTLPDARRALVDSLCPPAGGGTGAGARGAGVLTLTRGATRPAGSSK